MTPAPAPDAPFADADFAARLRAERSRILRRRVFWFCAGMLALLTLSALGDSFGVEEIKGDPARLRQAQLDLLYDGAMIAVFLGGLAYIWRWRPERAPLVAALTVLTILGAAVAIPFEMYLARAEPVPPGADPERWLEWRPGLFTLGAFGLIYGLAAVLVPMRPRESLRIVGACWAVYLVSLVAVAGAPARATVVLGALFPLTAGLGVAWGWWRYREFDARFRARELSGQYKELAAELSYARQVHEALFPPPVERGRVRIGYRYEPMREIGGDFLFVHPLAHPPAVHNGAVTAVLLDVTGHGVPAALAVNRLHSELQRLFALRADMGPGEALAALNAYSYASLTPSSMYASALIVRVDPGLGSLEWASAGHPPAFLRRGGMDGESVEELASTAVMLGVVGPELFEPGQRTTDFPVGDVLIGYTDGASDAVGKGGAPLGSAELLRLVRETPPAPEGGAGRLADALIERVRRHRVGRVTDDTLVVEVRLTG